MYLLAPISSTGFVVNPVMVAADFVGFVEQIFRGAIEQSHGWTEHGVGVEFRDINLNGVRCFSESDP